MLVKVLGAVDLASACAFLLLIFGIQPWMQYLLFCAGLLFLKGMFILTGDILSIIDLIASGTLLVALFISPAVVVLWAIAFLLLAKGFVSFV